MPRKPPPTSFRLFVAIYPPRDLAEHLLARLPALNLPAHRPTPIDQMHLTLQFIGDTRRNHLDDVLESVERAAGGIGSFRLSPIRLVTLPSDGSQPPRLVAIDTDSPAPLMELQRRLAHRLARNARERAGDRFRPHVTLCRFTNERGNPVVDLPLAGHAPFEVAEVRVMCSTLHSWGPSHEEVRKVALTSR